MSKKIIRQIRLFSNARKEPYLSFSKILGFCPHDISYYQLAVLHSSLATNSSENNNERLEFLGDAILSSIISSILYEKYKDEREGFLTNLRSKIVNRDSLNQLAVEIGLDKMIKATSNTYSSQNIYGNALEALIGAIYLDYDYIKCKVFVEDRLLRPFIDFELIQELEDNFKSKIIEWSQKNHLRIEFELVEETVTADNAHIFVSSLCIAGHEICRGKGSNKKESQQDASKNAFQLIEKTPNFIQGLSEKVEIESSFNNLEQ